jgi:hypothetical protein
MTASEVQALVDEKPRAQLLAADNEVKPLAEANTTNQHNRGVDNINGRPDGTSTEYLVRRLKRDAPAIAEALARGEYPSARAAGIAAGIVKVKTAPEWVWHWLGRHTRDRLSWQTPRASPAPH